ncbi:MAG: pirin family protein, partial [Cyclobacteriaceae bacterium]|nr:pirin family protein [Cyclobacteriaceae bacterium]
LDTNHTFSFANYYNEERMHFGALRVLNDDFVEGGMGFGKHPHDNMEIISIPLSGDLEHKDSMGNTTVIKQNDVQIMSAGTGVQHSEYNKNKGEKVNFLQLWIFPKVRDIAPRYDQKTFDPAERINKLQQIVSPVETDSGVTINQDAWLHLGNFENGFSTNYTIKNEGNGVYVFVLSGDVTINDQKLNKRDGFGIWEVDEFLISANPNAEILLIEVPMK